MRYDKIRQFEQKRDVGFNVFGIGILCRYIHCKYIVLFIILNYYQRKIESKIGFGHHVEGKTVDVNKKSNVGSRKCFEVGGSSYGVDRNCAEGDRNCIEGERFLFNVDGNPVMGRGKWNNGSRKRIDVKGKCFIVRKKSGTSRHIRPFLCL